MRTVAALVAAMLGTVGAAAPSPVAGARLAAACADATGWHETGRETFRLPQGLTRSQGVTSDGSGWIFSWQGGLERTNDTYLTQAYATLPPDIALQPQVAPDGRNSIGGNHIGDVDYYKGLVYAPVEDGGQGLGPVTLNDPEYQHPRIALYDAKTLRYTGVHYNLPLDLHAAGVPWVAINARAHDVYTGEWDMDHDRLNVFDPRMRFQRFLPLSYPPEWGSQFHLSRIQGAKVLGDALYATRDDADKSLYRIDLATGTVTKVLSLRPAVRSEIEGLAVRSTADGAVLHLLLVLHNKIDASGDFADIQVQFVHLACDVDAST